MVGGPLRPERWKLSKRDDLPISFTGVSALLSKKKRNEGKKERKLR